MRIYVYPRRILLVVWKWMTNTWKFYSENSRITGSERNKFQDLYFDIHITCQKPISFALCRLIMLSFVFQNPCWTCVYWMKRSNMKIEFLHYISSIIIHAVSVFKLKHQDRQLVSLYIFVWTSGLLATYFTRLIHYIFFILLHLTRILIKVWWHEKTTVCKRSIDSLHINKYM